MSFTQKEENVYWPCFVDNFLNFPHLNLTHPSLETKPTINQANLLQEATFTVFITVFQRTVLQFKKTFIEHLVSNQGDYTELYCDWFCCALEWKPSVLNLRIEIMRTVKSRFLTRLVQKHMQAFSDCLWRGFLILMYCDFLTKSWFPN